MTHDLVSPSQTADGIIATLHGSCAACDEPTEPGQRITRDAHTGLWRHVACDDHRAQRRAATVCRVCWTEKPCECDDQW